jgi:CRP/FNR family transcriptional regulator, dissimilatory nitrate respiration regulator
MVTLSSDERAAVASSLLKRFWLGEALSPPDLARIAGAASFRSMERGEVIIDYGSNVQHVYCVLGGTVKLLVKTERRKERAFELVVEGQTFGEGLVLVDRPSSGRVVAIEDGRLLLVPSRLLFTLLSTSPELALRWLRCTGQRVGRLLAELRADAGQSAAQRVVSWLLAQVGGQAGEARIRLDISKATLAALLNTTPETFSRVLKHLRDRGVLRVEGRELIVTDAIGLRYLQPCVFCGKPPAGSNPAPPLDPLHWQQLVATRGECEVPHWFGLGHCDCDVPHWCGDTPVVPK